VKRLAKTALLVLGIIAIAIGGILTFIFGILLAFAVELEAEYPGPDIAPGFWFGMYLWLGIGIVLICVGILLLILKARSKD
jgi:hypothetical protein